ncbi:MAG: WYL domain-containing protein [Rhodoluna sp.]|nr:WYL domain-containing protein [Rhodoluna sp.]
MPDQLRLDDSDRYNLMLALTGLLVQGDEYEVQALAQRFEVSKEEIVKAVKNIGYMDMAHFENPDRYVVDYDALEEGYVRISYNLENVVEDVPRLSSRQASALAAGLVYLSSLPGLAENEEIQELQAILRTGDSRGNTPEVLVQPGSKDADLLTIRQAIKLSRTMSCDYLNLKGEMRIARVIEPLRIDLRGELVYLKGWCPENRDVRSFRVDRMRNASMTEKKTSKEALSAVLDDEVYHPSEADTLVTIEVDPEAFSLMVDFRPIEEPETVSQYVKRFKILVGDVRNLGRIVARFGGTARVIAPDTARVAVREFAMQAMGDLNPTQPADAE